MDFARQWHPFSPDEAHLRLSAGNTPIVSIQRRGDVETMTLAPELSLTNGHAACASADTCGSWSRYDVNVLGSTRSAELPYAGDTIIDGWRIVHGELALATSQARCFDWFVAEAVVAAVKAPQ